MAILTTWNDADKTITLRHEEQTFNESTGGMDIEHLGEITLSSSEWLKAFDGIQMTAASHEHDAH